MKILKCSILFALLLVLALFLIANAWAAPSVSGVSGTVTHGASITISGSSFGTKSPAAPAVWDNMALYSGYTNGQCIPAGSSYTPCPAANPYGWYNNNDGSSKSPWYRTTARGVWPSHYSNYWGTAGVAGSGYAGQEIDLGDIPAAGINNTSTKVFYGTWWVYPYGNPNDSPTDGNKWSRMLAGTAGWVDTNYTYIIGPQTIMQIAQPTESYFVAWNSPQATPSAWNRIEQIMDNTGTNSIIYSNMYSGGSGYLTSGSQNAGALYPLMQQLAGLGADWANGNATQDPVLDWGEIYADNTYSRVEVCDATTWAARSHCEIQIPSAWSATSATVTVNQGSFSSGASAYLYVVDSTNTANSSGYPVTFGSGGGGSAPPMPSEPFLLSN
jgi:hypothetical protein